MTPRRAIQKLSFGGRVPWAVGLLVALTVVLSLFAALGDRGPGSVFALFALAPARVLGGQIWRLFTWSFVEIDPIALIFGCLSLYWFGGDLARGIGSRRFLVLYAGVALAASIATCLLTWLTGTGLDAMFLGGWSIACALMVGWGFSFRDRTVRIYFVIPVRGVVIAYFTLAATVVFAVYRGWVRYLPEIGAEVAMLGWLFHRPLRARWSRLRESAATHQRARERKQKRAKAAAYLRVIESHDDDTRLPPEVDRRLEELLRSRAKRDRSEDN